MVTKSCGDHAANLLYTFLDSFQHWPRRALRGRHAIGSVHSVKSAVYDLFPLSLELHELFLLGGELCTEFHAFGFLLGDESKQVCVFLGKRQWGVLSLGNGYYR